MVTARGIAINIRTKVQGLAEVGALETALTKLKTQVMAQVDVKKRVTAQTKLDTEIMKQNNQVLLAKTKMTAGVRGALAKQQVIQEDLTKQHAHQMDVERRAFRINQANIKEGMKSNITAARVAAETAVQEEVAYKRTEMALKAKRRALMQVSISMFVMNISVGQLLSSILPLVKGNEEATKALKGYQAVIMLSLGPMQAYMALKMIQINLEKQHAAAVMGVVAGMSAAYFWYAMLTTKSRELKIVLGALAGVMTAIAIVQGAIAISAWQAAVATATAQGVSTLGASLGVSLPIIAGGIGLAALVGATIGALLPTAQTRVGQMKKITKSGVAEVHEGEIWRPSRGEGAGAGMGVGDINIFMHPRYSGTVAESRYLAREIDRQVKTGQSSLKIKRTVIS